MTNFCHIAPTSLLEQFATGRSHHLTLAHLVEQDQQYADYYANLPRLSTAGNIECGFDVCNIMDNSAFEMYKRGEPMYPSEKLIEMGKKVNADYIVMSDYPNEDPKKTIHKAIEMAPELRDAGFGTFFVPQSEIGNLKGLIDSFMWAAESKHVDYIGVSILAVPNAYNVEKGNKLQRFLSRWSFCHLLRAHSFFEIARDNDKKIHFLGMTDGPNEIMLVKDYLKYIDTWDSSAGVWAGLNNILFDVSPSGLINGKFEEEVDFNFKTDDIGLINKAMANVHYIDQLIGHLVNDEDTIQV